MKKEAQVFSRGPDSTIIRARLFKPKSAFSQSADRKLVNMSHPEQRLLIYPYPFERIQEEEIHEFYSQSTTSDGQGGEGEMIELAPIATAVARPRLQDQPAVAIREGQYNNLSQNRPNSDTFSVREGSAAEIGQDQSSLTEGLFTSLPTNDVRPSIRHFNRSRPSRRTMTPPVQVQIPGGSDSQLRYFNSDCDEKRDRLDSSGWLQFQVAKCDGGEFSTEFGINNILQDDDSVYCSRSRQNVNVVLARLTRLTPMMPAPFRLEQVHVRIPSRGFTSPLRNGFLFICSRRVNTAEFDRYDSISTSGLLGADMNRDQVLPKVPPYVLTVLYFQLDRETNEFSYRFTSPIRNCRYVLVKFLTSFGAKDSIDIEFIGFRGQEEKLCFPKASLT